MSKVVNQEIDQLADLQIESYDYCRSIEEGVRDSWL